MSKRIVKRIRYALLLPVLHLLIVALPMFHRAQMLWDYIPTAQRAEDYEKDHPPTGAAGDYSWNCYEYRVSNTDRVIVAAEFPVAVLVGFDQECWPALVRPILNRLLKFRVRVSSRLILIDCLFLADTLALWFLIGRWLDLLNKRTVTMRWWIVLVAVISGGGIVMVPAVFHGDGLVEHVSILTGMAVVLAWLALLVTFAFVGIKKTWAVLRAPK